MHVRHDMKRRSNVLGTKRQCGSETTPQTHKEYMHAYIKRNKRHKVLTRFVPSGDLHSWVATKLFH